MNFVFTTDVQMYGMYKEKKGHRRVWKSQIDECTVRRKTEEEIEQTIVHIFSKSSGVQSVQYVQDNVPEYFLGSPSALVLAYANCF